MSASRMSENMESRITVSRDGDVAIVSINCLQHHNKMGRRMRQALNDAMHHLLTADATTRAIVLTGVRGNFCSGSDVSEMTDRSVLQRREILEESCVVVRDMLSGPKPVIAAIEGVAFGFGLALAAACDYAFAASDARFCADSLRIGLLPDTGIVWTLPRKIGMTKAREMLSLATEIDGVEAGRIGLANRVVEPGRAFAAAVEYAKVLAKRPPLGMAFVKSALTYGADTMEASLRTEIEYQAVLWQSKDHIEAVTALLENRVPIFFGQ